MGFDDNLLHSYIIAQNRMGLMDSRASSPQKTSSNLKAIEDIYLMFEQSNKVIIASIKQSSPSLTASRIKNIDSVVDELLSPFSENTKYQWASDITVKFKQHFSKSFQVVWSANREQFYELLLLNCNINKQIVKGMTFQEYFYKTAIHTIQQVAPVNSVSKEVKEDDFTKFNMSILHEAAQNNNDLDLPLFIPHNMKKNSTEYEGMQEIQLTEYASPEVDVLKQKMYNCSLILPETLFPDRLSRNSSNEVTDLLKYYNKFVYTINQLFYSNNMISCPLKHFIFSIQQKVHRKKLKVSHKSSEVYSQINEQIRKIRKTRQINNNILLYELRFFVDAYTSFVWMYLQLHLMAESRLQKIINAEILYGIIFKSVWGFVDWLVQRGYQYEEGKLQQYYLNEPAKNEAKLSSGSIAQFSNLIDGLRNEKHPQQYLKKVVIFYRQISRSCQNADQLLLIYEQTLSRSIKSKGSRDLYLFRMKNVIQKLLKIDQNSMSGGQISYSWTTWCILIQILRQKINFKYGNLVVSKKSLQHEQQQHKNTSFTIEKSVIQMKK